MGILFFGWGMLLLISIIAYKTILHFHQSIRNYRHIYVFAVWALSFLCTFFIEMHVKEIYYAIDASVPPYLILWLFGSLLIYLSYRLLLKLQPLKSTWAVNICIVLLTLQVLWGSAEIYYSLKFMPYPCPPSEEQISVGGVIFVPESYAIREWKHFFGAKSIQQLSYECEQKNAKR
jgi:hypothetical protein